MTVVYLRQQDNIATTSGTCEVLCLSTDAKPGSSDGATSSWTLSETDTGKRYKWANGAWSEILASDAWSYVSLTAAFTASAAAAVDITGLAFTPAANTTYEFEGQLMLRTSSATVNPRPGLAWPTGMTDGVANIEESQTATTALITKGNIGAALLTAVGGLPDATQSWPCSVWGVVQSGSSPSGSVRLQLASETAGTNVFARAKSFLRYRALP